MRTIDIRGITNIELVRGGTSEWYWATDYVHGDLYEAEELFRQKNSVQSNRLYLIHYPDGMVYEPVLPVDGQYLGYPVFDGESVVLLVVNFTESAIRLGIFALISPVTTLTEGLCVAITICIPAALAS